MNEDDLLDSYRSVGRTSCGGELWLSHDAARRFVDDCERFDFLILGADFVVRDESGVLPVAIADYTAGGAQPSVREAARAFRKLIRDGFPEGATEVSIVISRPGAF